MVRWIKIGHSLSHSNFVAKVLLMVARILQGHALSLSLSAIDQIVPPLNHLIGWANVARFCLLDAPNKHSNVLIAPHSRSVYTFQGNQHANSLLVSEAGIGGSQHRKIVHKLHMHLFLSALVCHLKSVKLHSLVCWSNLQFRHLCVYKTSGEWEAWGFILLTGVRVGVHLLFVLCCTPFIMIKTADSEACE